MIETLFVPNQSLNEQAAAEVMANFYQPCEPEGGFGRLEEFVFKLSAHQASSEPVIERPMAYVFAADHGLVSSLDLDHDSSQTVQRLQAICCQRASIHKVAGFSNVPVKVIDVGSAAALSQVDGLEQLKISNGTQNFTEQPAMTQEQLISALLVGVQVAENAKASGADLFVSGEIGMGAVQSAVAMVSVLSGQSAEQLLGMGKQRLMRSEKLQAELIDKALRLHKDELNSPLKVLQYLGGFETAALCGAYLRCAQLGLSVVVDGIMSTVAAWIADLVSRNDQLAECQSMDEFMTLGKYSVPESMFCICGDCPRLLEWCFFAHQVDEQSHQVVLETLAVEPLLKFDIKVGQGLGAVLAVPLLQQACLTYQALPKNPALMAESEAID